jgi:hypothetical protein
MNTRKEAVVAGFIITSWNLFRQTGDTYESTGLTRPRSGGLNRRSMAVEAGTNCDGDKQL